MESDQDGSDADPAVNDESNYDPSHENKKSKRPKVKGSRKLARTRKNRKESTVDVNDDDNISIGDQVIQSDGSVIQSQQSVASENLQEESDENSPTPVKAPKQKKTKTGGAKKPKKK